jgi:transposase
VFKKIGGDGDAVQVDETHVSKRKYNEGRSLCHFWIVGGISEKTNRIFMTSTIQRTQPILKAYIEEYIEPKTIIKTDCWKGYNWLDKSADYSHKTLNHKKNFKDPKDGTHTNKIERLWFELKEMKRRRRGFKIDHLEDYIQEFIWRRNILSKSENKFFEVLSLAKHYLK